MLGETELPSSYLLVEVFIRCSSEGELAAQHSKEENAGSPDISWWTDILFFHNYFWAHIGRCTTENLEFNVTRSAAAETKVNELYNSFLGVNDDVLEFDVSMCHISLM